MPVRLERPSAHPHVALVTLDRPERANALDPRMLSELAGAWREIAADSALRCAVVTGAGERVFCSGMDMRATIPVAQALARGERAVGDRLEQEFERTLILRALAHTGGHRMEAAQRLGWGRNTLTRKIQELGLEADLRKSPREG